jgi:hypothetical protein
MRSLEDNGFAFEVVTGRLRVQPASHLTEKQRQAIRQDRDGLITLIRLRDQLAVLWRVEAMRQHAILGQALPLMVARRDVEATPDACLSCGDSLTRPVPVVGIGRCAACRRAAWIIANDVNRQRDAAAQPSGSVVTTEPQHVRRCPRPKARAIRRQKPWKCLLRASVLAAGGSFMDALGRSIAALHVERWHTAFEKR